MRLSLVVTTSVIIASPTVWGEARGGGRLVSRSARAVLA
jgi:hypothetical protein